jgi:hypothetical protein
MNIRPPTSIPPMPNCQHVRNPSTPPPEGRFNISVTPAPAMSSSPDIVDGMVRVHVRIVPETLTLPTDDVYLAVREVLERTGIAEVDPNDPSNRILKFTNLEVGYNYPPILDDMLISLDPEDAGPRPGLDVAITAIIDSAKETKSLWNTGPSSHLHIQFSVPCEDVLKEEGDDDDGDEIFGPVEESVGPAVWTRCPCGCHDTDDTDDNGEKSEGSFPTEFASLFEDIYEALDALESKVYTYLKHSRD